MKITISIGTTMVIDKDTHMQTLPHSADQVLYPAKNSGINKVFIYKVCIYAPE